MESGEERGEGQELARRRAPPSRAAGAVSEAAAAARDRAHDDDQRDERVLWPRQMDAAAEKGEGREVARRRGPRSRAAGASEVAAASDRADDDDQRDERVLGPRPRDAAAEKGEGREVARRRGPRSRAAGASEVATAPDRAEDDDLRRVLKSVDQREIAARKTGEAPSLVGSRAHHWIGAQLTQRKLLQMEQNALHVRGIAIPRRGIWSSEMTPEELDTKEREAFIMWRKSLLARFRRMNTALAPFEKRITIWRHLWRVLENSDLVVTVVDGRNPLLYCCPDLEAYIKEIDEHKGTLLLVNKSDLVPLNIRKKWSEYFKAHGIPYVFWSAKAAMEPDELLLTFEGERLGKCSEEESASLDLHTKIYGVDELLLKLQNEAQSIAARRTRGVDASFCSDALLAKHAVIGFVGYPSVGKSLTIDALLTHADMDLEPKQFTNEFWSRQLDSGELILCGCPGLVFPSLSRSRHEMAAYGVLPVERTMAFEATQVVADRVPRNTLEQVYKINLPELKAYESQSLPPAATDLLQAYGARRGFDEMSAAHVILGDFFCGKLPHFQLPPVTNDDQIQDVKALDFDGPITLPAEGVVYQSDEMDPEKEKQSRTADQLAIDCLRAKVYEQMIRPKTKIGKEDINKLQDLAQEIRIWFRCGKASDAEVLLIPYKMIGRELMSLEILRNSALRIDEKDYNKALVKEKLKKMIGSLESLKDKFQSEVGLVRIINIWEFIEEAYQLFLERGTTDIQKIIDLLKVIMCKMDKWDGDFRIVPKICQLDDKIYECINLGRADFYVLHYLSHPFITCCEGIYLSAENIVKDEDLFPNEAAVGDAKDPSALEKFQQIMAKLKSQSHFVHIFSPLFKGYGNLINNQVLSSMEQPRCAYCFGKGANYFTTCCHEIFCSSCVKNDLYLVCEHRHMEGKNLHSPLIQRKLIHR